VELNRQEKLIIRSPELAGNPTSSQIVVRQDGLTKEMNLAFDISLSYFEGFFNMP
jgi:hypothetical protein